MPAYDELRRRLEQKKAELGIEIFSVQVVVQ